MKRSLATTLAALFLLASPANAATFSQQSSWSCSTQGAYQSGQIWVGSLDPGSVTVSHEFEACNLPGEGFHAYLQVNAKDAKNVTLAVTAPDGHAVAPVAASKGTGGDYFLTACELGQVGTYTVTVTTTKAVQTAGLVVLSGSLLSPCP